MTFMSIFCSSISYTRANSRDKTKILGLINTRIFQQILKQNTVRENTIFTERENIISKMFSCHNAYYHGRIIKWTQHIGF